MVRESVGNNGITFGMDGPMMTGTWQNPRTGDKFTVRDCFLQDGQMIVQTLDGRMLDYNIVQNYVQCTDENGNHVNLPVQNPMSGNKTSKKNDIPQEILDMIDDSPNSSKANEDLILPEDKVIFQPFSQIIDDKPKDMSSTLSYTDGENVVVHENYDKNGSLINKHVETIVHGNYDKNGNLINKQTETLVNTDVDIDKQWAHKVLKKKTIPSINIEAAWEDIPSKAIETLIETLGVEPETLIDYYVERIYNEIDIEKEVKAKLKMVIEDVIEDIQQLGAADFHNAYRSTLGDKVVDNVSDVEDDLKEYKMTADFQLNQQEKFTSNPTAKAKKPTKKTPTKRKTTK